MAVLQVTEMHLLQAAEEIEGETGFSGHFAEPSEITEGLEWDVWREMVLEGHKARVKARAMYIASKEQKT